MAYKLDLNIAEGVRTKLTQQQQREIEQMYKRISRSISQQTRKLPNTTSGALRNMYLSQLRQQINEQLRDLGQGLEGSITANMLAVSDAVVEDNLRFLRYVDMPIQGAFSHVSKDVVESIITGQVYKGNWSLSNSIWRTTQKAQADINRIIAEGVAQNRSVYDIAKDLERYVNPSARLPWDWNKVYPGTSNKVDYNAQRLARTMISHAYQQSFVRTTQKNPFVTKYRWESSNSARICDVCASRDGVLYDKDDLPMDHPNGMCTYIAVMEDSLVDIADRIADWALGEKADPDLDAYYEFLVNS